MFSTFTGNSRRPRNVNLSGTTGNPFTNTSWSPSAVSNTTKTVSNAQAEREKRQADRAKLKAAGKIQRIWRGYKTRAELKESQRNAFDALYKSGPRQNPCERLPKAFGLLLSFFSLRRDDDIQRAICYAHDTESVDLEAIAPSNVHPSRVGCLVQLLLQALDRSLSIGDLSGDTHLLFKLVLRIVTKYPELVIPAIDSYYTVVAKLCQFQNLSGQWQDVMLQAISRPLEAASHEGTSQVYRAYAFSFLAKNNLYFFEENISTLSNAVRLSDLSKAIVTGLSSPSSEKHFQDAQLWQLAHFIDLSRFNANNSSGSGVLETLYTQLSSLSSTISVRLLAKSTDGDENSSEEPLVPSLDPYITARLMSLVDSNGISQTLHEFSTNLAGSSSQEYQSTSFLAGYILTLLRCFPANSDDIRMRLFLEEIPTTSGDVPTIKFLWHIMSETAVFEKLRTESEAPLNVLRRYLGVTSETSNSLEEEQDWRIALLFLELYIFILRLSDDEDFFSGIDPRIMEQNQSISRIRSCSLSLEDVKMLTSFLKNTAFTLHYRAQDLSKSADGLEAASRYRIDTYFGSGQSSAMISEEPSSPTKSPTRLDIDSLRNIVTTAMKMLYERDSRKQFLPTDHWLMTSKLDQSDFISAVIAEEKRQIDENSDGSDVEGSEHGDGPGLYSTIVGQRLSRHARLEKLKAQQIRSQRERRLAEMKPKLEILKHMPFAVPFETRVQIFRHFIQLDRQQRGDNSQSFFAGPYAKHHAQISRNSLFDDAYKQFYEIGEGLKDPIQITFVDQFGTAEAGIDGGGVTKEFLISVTTEAFGAEGGRGMFTSNEKGLLFPDPTALDVIREELRHAGMTEADSTFRDMISDLLKRYEFLGRIVGKCMYEGILVDLAFAGFFLLKWTSTGPNDENTYKGSVNDLRDMDEDLYRGMLRLKNYPGDVSELGIDFTIEDQVSDPKNPVKTVTRKLIANGDQIHVTNDNRLLYISYVARHRLVVQPAPQTSAFLRGLRSIIRPSWLSMFNQSELQRLVGGDSSEIDIEDLRNHTIYSGLYQIGDDGEEHETIKLFWKVMRSFTDDQRRAVLKYVSSTPRAPLLGFSQLRPLFSIRDGGTDEERLPSTSTCVNLLKLPRYTSEATLREKLLYAVQSGAGFDLS
ncbi:ubiquitin-protein ligase E3 C [Fusarium oxysporum f. sp. lycopersici 4287]|uniref:HECT-type E3 ubiquitin transferase n=1 Tax=Fusarium oxysporum f. sp. lycopersici (strain 4287 / CBS 123668 / FGSC 9935 / NRRL 34936) TaxID=426428 RepID=A0A0J9UJW3_FUSO4|nr:ubiquitin-protein ligase E3 C [Fusarium oxysporum f. sp. lycopersici 4287]KAJ9420710.1 ubiquitin-protein ligase [Fusarium oxysporum]KNA99147.1 ubiquitin-protein ligase E3 C [Fusarium oxysporum f. sp. lycopersici 4287]